MNKKSTWVIIAVIILIGLAGGYIFWRQNKKVELQEAPPAINQAGEEAEKITETATQGVLPSLEVANPLENRPSVNPVDQTNPFKDIKTNPFD